MSYTPEFTRMTVSKTAAPTSEEFVCYLCFILKHLWPFTSSLNVNLLNSLSHSRSFLFWRFSVHLFDGFVGYFVMLCMLEQNASNFTYILSQMIASMLSISSQIWNTILPEQWLAYLLKEENFPSQISGCLHPVPVPGYIFTRNIKNQHIVSIET